MEVLQWRRRCLPHQPWGTFAFAWKVHRFSPEDPQRAGRKRWVGEGASSRSWGRDGSLLIRGKTETRTHAWDQGCSIYRIHLAVYKSPGRLAESWKGSLKRRGLFGMDSLLINALCQETQLIPACYNFGVNTLVRMFLNVCDSQRLLLSNIIDWVKAEAGQAVFLVLMSSPCLLPSVALWMLFKGRPGLWMARSPLLILLTHRACGAYMIMHTRTYTHTLAHTRFLLALSFSKLLCRLMFKA